MHMAWAEPHGGCTLQLVARAVVGSNAARFRDPGGRWHYVFRCDSHSRGEPQRARRTMAAVRARSFLPHSWRAGKGSVHLVARSGAL